MARLEGAAGAGAGRCGRGGAGAPTPDAAAGPRRRLRRPVHQLAQCAPCRGYRCVRLQRLPANEKRQPERRHHRILAPCLACVDDYLVWRKSRSLPERHPCCAGTGDADQYQLENPYIRTFGHITVGFLARFIQARPRRPAPLNRCLHGCASSFSTSEQDLQYRDRVSRAFDHSDACLPALQDRCKSQLISCCMSFMAKPTAADPQLAD